MKDTDHFVPAGSIVRKIWGCSDTILFIFAGSAAEFALNKSVDWLYFTGKLPADPIGRMFSTVEYSRQIVFSDETKATQALQKIAAIHKDVERKRGFDIPSTAYLDVLFMLIDYSIRAFELLERPLREEEKEEIYQVFRKQGIIMNLPVLPATYETWLPMRESYLRRHLVSGPFTSDLFGQYKKHLGTMRYRLLCRIQAMLAPKEVRKHLPWLNAGLFPALLIGYKWSKALHLDHVIKRALLPAAYREQISGLDVKAGKGCPFKRIVKPQGVKTRPGGVFPKPRITSAVSG